MKSALVILPCYGHHDYAIDAVHSLMQTCKVVDPYVVITDDATPDMLPYDNKKWDELLDPLWKAYNKTADKKVALFAFPENHGLTFCWNHGLILARGMNVDYAVCGNSDVIFTTGWDTALCHALDHGLDLVGPVTNAPGNVPDQYVGNYLADYQLTDDDTVLRTTANILYLAHGHHYQESPINGFCMMAKTSVWHDHCYDDYHVFKPHNDFNSKGQRNPTPLMTLNETEFQHRLHAKGGKSGYCPGSLVFHFRAVSRGDQYKQGSWYRRKSPS